MKFKKIITVLSITFLTLVSATALPVQDDRKENKGVIIHKKGGKAPQREAPKHLESIALQRLTERISVMTQDLEIVSSFPARYQELNLTVYKFQILDPQQKHYIVVLDEQGQLLDEDELDEKELAARRAKYGKLTSALHEYLKQAKADAEIEVLVEVQLPDMTDEPQQQDMDSDRINRMSRQEKEAFNKKEEEYQRKIKAYHANRRKKYVDPVVERVKKLGLKVTDLPGTHRFAVKLKPQMIRELEKWEEIREIHILQKNKYKPELDISRVVIGADVVESRGVNGNGVNVAMVETLHRVIPAFPNPFNPFLAGMSQSGNFVCTTASEHGAAVAGVIRSTATLPPTFRGISPNVSLFAIGSCNAVDSEFMSESNAAIALGFKILNLSFGGDPAAGTTNQTTLQPLDKFYDEKVRFDRAVVVKSAGNNSGGFGTGTTNVTSPGLGYNVITVGNFDDRNTLARGDDVMHASSSFRDPLSDAPNDRNKPEVSAPGTLIHTTLRQQRLGQWTHDHFLNNSQITGTSLAAPHVTGMAALIHHRANMLSVSAIPNTPELVKAIVIASSGHDIGTATVDREGTGNISAPWADDVVVEGAGHGGWGRATLNCSSTYPFLMGSAFLFPAIRARIALTWSTDPTFSNYNTKPSADLILRLVPPSGSPVIVNVFNDTYEWIDFTPLIGGTYQIFVDKVRCKKDPKTVAYAFWQHH